MIANYLHNFLDYTETYILKSPGGVNNGFDDALLPQLHDAFHGTVSTLRASLLTQQMAQVESSQRFVLIKQLDWWYFIHLPPLKHTNYKNVGRNVSTVYL